MIEIKRIEHKLWCWRTQWMNWKLNAIEHINSNLNQAEERICEIGDRSFKITSERRTKKKIMEKELWKPKETIYVSLRSQKEKRGRKGQKAYFEKYFFGSSSNLGRCLATWVHKSQGLFKISIPNDLPLERK